jgi:hypothetical protein
MREDVKIPKPCRIRWFIYTERLTDCFCWCTNRRGSNSKRIILLTGVHCLVDLKHVYFSAFGCNEIDLPFHFSSVFCLLSQFNFVDLPLSSLSLIFIHLRFFQISFSNFQIANFIPMMRNLFIHGICFPLVWMHSARPGPSTRPARAASRRAYGLMGGWAEWRGVIVWMWTGPYEHRQGT